MKSTRMESSKSSHSSKSRHPDYYGETLSRVSRLLGLGLRSNIRRLSCLAWLLILFSSATQSQEPRVKWEELTAEDFSKAIEKSQGTCLLPFGILEKHGPHLPLGTDLLN